MINIAGVVVYVIACQLGIQNGPKLKYEVLHVIVPKYVI